MHLNTILFYSLYDYKKLRALRNGFARHFLPTLHSRAKLYKQKIDLSPVISGDRFLEYYTCFRFGGFGMFLRLKINRKNVILSFKRRHFYNLIHALDHVEIRRKTINLLTHLSKVDALSSQNNAECFETTKVRLLPTSVVLIC